MRAGYDTYVAATEGGKVLWHPPLGGLEAALDAPPSTLEALLNVPTAAMPKQVPASVYMYADHEWSLCHKT